MKKKYGLWLYLIIIICMITCFCSACFEKTAEEPLTDAESKFVGTWVLDDIGYMDYSKGGLNILRYPSNSNAFNELCEQYLDKTKIIFNGSKRDGKISGILYVGDQTYDFSWNGWDLDENVPRVDFVKQFKLLSYSSTTDNTVSKTLFWGVIMDDGKLYLSPETTMKYVFKKL